ncbi:MAG: efflux RND transporter periplasmic adaptor subunit [Verrucomicrobiota bacterium]
MRIKFFGRILILGLMAGLVTGQTWAIIDNSVAAQGLIVPKGGLVHVAAPTGAAGQPIVAELLVNEGDRVEKGQVIATLVGRPGAEASVAIASLEASANAKNLEVLQAQQAVVQSRIRAQEEEINVFSSQQANVQSQVVTAQSQVKQAQAGATVAEHAKLEALAKIDGALTKMEAMHAHHQRTLDDWDPPRRESEEIKFQQKTLAEEHNELAGTRPAVAARLDAEIAAAQVAVSTAEAQLAAVESQRDTIAAQAAAAKGAIEVLKSEALVLEAELRRAQAASKTAEAAIGQARAQLALTQVVAPIEGTVLYVGAESGEAVGFAGVVTLGDLSELYVDAEVYIDDIRKVKVGQKATIRSDAFEGEKSAVVTEVGRMVNPQALFSNDPLAFSDKKVVVVRIKLDAISGWTPPVHTLVVARIQTN